MSELICWKEKPKRCVRRDHPTSPAMIRTASAFLVVSLAIKIILPQTKKRGKDIFSRTPPTRFLKNDCYRLAALLPRPPSITQWVPEYG
jgi:hypothetical protein